MRPFRPTLNCRSSSNHTAEEIVSDAVCAICCDQMTNPQYLACNHAFCKQCLQKLILSDARKNGCPLCRAPLQKHDSDRYEQLCAQVASLVRNGDCTHETELLCRRTIAIQPERSFGYTLLGLVQASQSRFDEAIEAYEKANQISPHPTTYNNLGVLLCSKGNISAAMQAYNQGIKIVGEETDSSELYFNLANAHRYKQNLPAAVNYYKKAITVNPRHDAAHVNLGNTLLLQGDLDTSVAVFERFLKLTPTTTNSSVDQAKFSLSIAKRTLPMA